MCNEIPAETSSSYFMCVHLHLEAYGGQKTGTHLDDLVTSVGSAN